jgi:hypothetical protein
MTFKKIVITSHDQTKHIYCNEACIWMKNKYQSMTF